MSVIALDLGGTKLAAAVFEETGNISHKRIYALSGRGGNEVGELIREAIKTLQHEAAHEHIPVTGIGICVPGISNTKTDTVWAPNIRGWEEYPLKKEIQDAVKNRNLKVAVDNDRACSVLGEKWKGAAQHCDHVVFIAVGTGIGAGIIADGNVLRGAHDISGATGWMALGRPYEEKYKSCGCFEYYASGEGIVRSAKEFIGSNKNYDGILKKYHQLTAKDIFSAYATGDLVARQTIKQAIELWGMAAANFISIFNPEKIIFGGGVFSPAAEFLPDIKKEAAKWAQPIAIKQVEFVVSLLGKDAALFGAASLAF